MAADEKIILEQIVENKQAIKQTQLFTRELNRLTDEVSKGNKTIKQAESSLYHYGKAIGLAKDKQQQLQVAANQATKSMARQGQSARYLGIQFGYLVSDINYGVLGIANNVSQIGVSMAAAWEEAGGSIKKFGQNLKGAFLGVNGFLILFQVAVALWQRWSMKAQQAKRDIEKFTYALAGSKGTIVEMNAWADVLNDTNSSIDDQKIALENLKKFGYDPAKVSLENFLKAKTKLLIFEATKKVIQKEIEDLITEQRRLEIAKEEADKKLSDAKTKYNQVNFRGNAHSAIGSAGPGARTAGDIYLGKQNTAQQEADKAGKDLDLVNQKVVDKSKELSDKLKEILGDKGIFQAFFSGDPDDPDGTKSLKTFLKSFENATEEFDKTQLEVIEIQRQRSLEKLKNEFGLGEGSDAWSIINSHYDNLTTLEERKIKEKEIKKAQAAFKAEREALEARNKSADDLAGLGEDPDVLRLKNKLEQEAEILNAAWENEEIGDEEHKQRMLEANQRYVEGLDELKNKKKEILEAEATAKRESAFAQVASLGQTLQALAEGNKKMGGLAIAGLVMENAASVASIWNKLPETKAKYEAGFATIPIVGPALAKAANVIATVQAVAGTALAVKRTKDGIAKIRAAGGSGGGGASSGGSQPPTFNVIGATGTNALKQVVESQTQKQEANANKPVQAYVVEDQMQAQQMQKEEVENQTSFG